LNKRGEIDQPSQAGAGEVADSTVEEGDVDWVSGSSWVVRIGDLFAKQVAARIAQYSWSRREEDRALARTITNSDVSLQDAHLTLTRSKPPAKLIGRRPSAHTTFVRTWNLAAEDLERSLGRPPRQIEIVRAVAEARGQHWPAVRAEASRQVHKKGQQLKGFNKK
jgi:hypothetical protein